MASDVRVSSPSDNRATSGAAPRCSTSRKASTPSANERKNHPSKRRSAGRGRTRRVTSVITPSAPSEPTTTSRREGPAAVPGNAATASSPAGAVHRTPRTSSSKRP